MKHNTLLLTVLLVFAALVVHLSVSWQDFSTLARNGYLYDDSFYAFQIARNIAAGEGPTFDGVIPTNGFQPLYVFLLVPIYELFGADPVTPIYVALTLLALFTAATSLLLFLILRRYVSEPLAFFAAALWTFSPVVIRQSANGLETALALFLFALSVYYYLARVRSDPGGGWGRFATLGLILGLAILARVDQLFLALTMALDYLLVMRRRAKRGEANGGPGGVLIAAATAILVYIPWAVYGWKTVGSPLQESGAATRFLSLAYAPFFDLGTAGLAQDGPNASFIWAHVVHSLAVLKLSPPVHALFRAVEKATGGGASWGALPLIVNAASLAALALFAFWVVRRRRARGEISFLLLFSVLLMAAYSTYVFGAFFFTRYFYPVFFVATIFAACALRDLTTWAKRKPAFLRAAFAAGVGAYAVALLYMGYNSAYRSMPVYHFYDVARWVEDNTGESETIGVFQCGAIGYFSNRRVINLDGKVNHYALAALKRGDICTYITQAGIDVVMDHSAVLNLFLGPFGESGVAGIEARKVFTGKSVGANGWVGFRLNGSAASAGAFLAPGHADVSPVVR